MEKGLSLSTRLIMNSLDDETELEILNLLRKMSEEKFQTPNFQKELQEYYENIFFYDALTLRSYTGYNFKEINTILRNTWNYEENGKITKEKEQQIKQKAEEIETLIEKFPKTPTSFMTYRGTTLKEFKKYGIHSIEELSLLNGKYLYEEGFTSTSLKEETCYYNKNINNEKYNIEIKYKIPKDSQDGIPLTTEDLSYSKNQLEYVLNRGALSKVLAVEINNSTAIITVLLIPKNIWNKMQKIESDEIGKNYGFK